MAVVCGRAASMAASLADSWWLINGGWDMARRTREVSKRLPAAATAACAEADSVDRRFPAPQAAVAVKEAIADNAFPGEVVSTTSIDIQYH